MRAFWHDVQDRQSGAVPTTTAPRWRRSPTPANRSPPEATAGLTAGEGRQ